MLQSRSAYLHTMGYGPFSLCLLLFRYIYIYTHTLYFASLYIAQFVPSTPLFASYPAEQVKHGYMRKP